MSTNKGWIGVDLDGTLAHYDGWRGLDHIGEPVPAMVERVKAWLEEGRDVRIFTARIAPRGEDSLVKSGVTLESIKARAGEYIEATVPIMAWCVKVFGRPLKLVYKKDMFMAELWDDRCVCVERNTGRILGQNPEADVSARKIDGSLGSVQQ